MNTLVKVTYELDRLRGLRKEQQDPLYDEDYWNLCRMAIGAKQNMPRDDVVRRVAYLVDQLQTRT